MKIVLLESLGVDSELIDRLAQPLLAQGHTFVHYEDRVEEQVLIERARDADAVILANMPFRKTVIQACRNLKFIDIAFTGVDHVDLEAAREQGIRISNASGYSNQSVAELVLGMMLSLLRNMPQVEKRCRQGQTKDGLVGRELRGKTVGIIGYGAIGAKTAQLCRAFGAKVIASRRTVTSGVDENGVSFQPIDEIMKTADIISLHCPLTEATKNLINRDRLALMKKDAYLINAARGPVVDSKALAEALNEGRIAGAGIDVFETEPPIDEGHPLLHAKNTILTPHVAFATKESLEIRAGIVFDNLYEWLAGRQDNIIL